MDLDNLTKNIISILEDSGFTLSRIQGATEMSFDLVARLDEVLILAKIVPGKDLISKRSSSEMKLLANILGASPVIFIPSSRSSVHRDGVLYISYGIPMMTMNSLSDHLTEGIPPMVYHGPGGHYVSVDGNELRSRREAMGISLGTIANEIGVSRRAVQMYESGMGVDLETALRLEKFLNIELILPLDPFSKSDQLQEIRDGISRLKEMGNEVFDHLGDIGMEVIPTSRCPFDALARTGNDLLMTSIGDRGMDLAKLGGTLSDISKITGTESFLIATGPVRGRNIGGTPVLSVKDVVETDNIDDLLDMIRKRKK